MRPVILKLFLSIVCIVIALQTHAQTCTGSLGDPVINQDFGSGTGQGPALAAGITTLTYTNSNCPQDGQYTISNNLSGANNCHVTWQNVVTDHTGNPNGYMMIINASAQPSIFFTQTANNLCPNTTYEFSSYILNLITLAASGPGVSEPNIVFSIETASGQVLATDNTGVIPSTSNPQWNKYGVFFTTPANVTDVVVKMTNVAPGGNGNDLILDDITFRACGPIIASGFASISGSASQQLCEGSTANYSLRAGVIGNNNPAYQWQTNNGNGWTDLSGETANSYNAFFIDAIPGVYQYRVAVGNSSNISSVNCRVYSQPLTVTVTALPVVPPIPPQTLCYGSTLQLTASGGTSYIWSGPNLPPTSVNPLIINNVSAANSGTYKVQAFDANNCASAPVQTIITVTPQITAAISKDTTICAGESVQLNASGGLYYEWIPSIGLNNSSIPNPVAAPSVTTTYHVTISNGGCVDTTKSVTITVNQPPVANAGSDLTIFEGQAVRLNGSDSGDKIISTTWTPATALSDPGILTPIASPRDSITYTLTVVSQNCGIAISKVFVAVFKKITIPNTFSPNNDGINDIWDIKALVTYPACSVVIYNRYGQKVYQSTGYPKPWDGTSNNSPLPEGTYYYIIDLKNNTPKLAGWVVIVR